MKTLLTSVAEEVGKYEVACDYDFTYDNFTIHAATGYDVLRKVQSETKANIYLRGKTLHVHPQYAQIGEKVIYDFAVNIGQAKVAAGEPLDVVKGSDLSGKNNILFIRNSVSGRIEARYRKVGIALNEKLHKN